MAAETGASTLTGKLGVAQGYLKGQYDSGLSTEMPFSSFFGCELYGDLVIQL